MKIVYLALSLLYLSIINLYAEPIDRETAREIAQQFLEESLPSSSLRGYPGDTGECYYAFDRKKGGYILISSDDELTPILGYSDRDSFEQARRQSPELDYFLETYSAYVKAVREGRAKPYRSQLRSAEVVIAPLVKTRWNQNAPYNQEVPTYILSGIRRHYYTGCLATSMAQLMYYHKWPLVGKGEHSYDGPNGETLSRNFSLSRYDWEHMKLLYSSVDNPTTQESRAVAQLMGDIGVAVAMKYRPSGSSANVSSGIWALEHYFSYSSRSYKRQYYTTESFKAKIAEELTAGMPIIYYGLGTEGGHAWIVDGLDSNGFVHCNWGWGGESDGYFNINYMDPVDIGIGGGAGGYENEQGFIAARPIRSGEEPYYRPSVARGASGIMLEDEGKILKLAYYVPIGLNNMQCDIGVLLEGEDGTEYYAPVSYTEYSMNQYYWYQSTFKTSEVFRGVPKGIYKVRSVYRLSATDPWQLMEQRDYLCVEKLGDELFRDEAKSISLQLVRDYALGNTVYLGERRNFNIVLEQLTSELIRGELTLEITRPNDPKFAKYIPLSAPFSMYEGKVPKLVNVSLSISGVAYTPGVYRATLCIARDGEDAIRVPDYAGQPKLFQLQERKAQPIQKEALLSMKFFSLKAMGKKIDPITRELPVMPGEVDLIVEFEIENLGAEPDARPTAVLLYDLTEPDLAPIRLELWQFNIVRNYPFSTRWLDLPDDLKLGHKYQLRFAALLSPIDAVPASYRPYQDDLIEPVFLRVGEPTSLALPMADHKSLVRVLPNRQLDLSAFGCIEGLEIFSLSGSLLHREKSVSTPYYTYPLLPRDIYILRLKLGNRYYHSKLYL